MSSGKIPILHLRGDAYARGKQHGVALSTSIQTSFLRLRRSTADRAWLRAERRAANSWRLLEGMAPTIVAELKGIADGSGLAPLDIYLLSGFEFFDGAVANGCTTVACATGAGAVLAQNWDALPGTEEELVLLVHDGIDDDDGGLIMVTSPGTLGWVGMNRAGLAFVTNDLMLDAAAHGMPSLVVRRLILKERHTAGALATLRRVSHMSGRCYLLADASAQVDGVEISPSIGPVALTGSPIVHTNHPLTSSVAIMEDIETAARIYPSSRERLRAAKLHCISDVAGICRLLSDTNGAPDAICKTASPREPTQTAFSVIFECRRRRASICLGRPDRGDFHAFDTAWTAAA
ncbi:C45 family autoproteolytic acyltransferase/hydolase [Rhizobium tibeticum]|nr:C45 family peptidase [Rhizobium tibeticum]